MRTGEVRKAIAAYVLPLVGAIGTALSDGHATTVEIWAAIGVALVTGTTVYRVPNDQPPATHRRVDPDDEQPPY